MSASQEGLVSTVSGTQAREQPLAPEKFGADSFASVTLSATSGAKCLSPCFVSRHRNLCIVEGGVSGCTGCSIGCDQCPVAAHDQLLQFKTHRKL